LDAWVLAELGAQKARRLAFRIYRRNARFLQVLLRIFGNKATVKPQVTGINLLEI
jgi:hypothetical protein